MGICDLKVVSNDCLRKDYIFPAKVLWQSEGAENTEILLNAADGQANNGEKRPIVKLSTTEGKKAAFLLDFGSEFSGGVRIITQMISMNDVPHVPGVKMHIRFGESVSEAMTPLGARNSWNAHTPRDFVVPLMYYGSTEWGQTGYRFLYLELETPDVYVELAAVHGIFTYRDIPYIGSFACSNSILGDIYNTSAYTVHLNMQSMLWDGIKRDRLVWIGDMHPEVLAIRSVFGYNSIVDDSPRYVAESYPVPDWPNHITSYGMWYLLILRDWCFHNGKKDLLQELKNYWVPLLEQLAALVHSEGKPLIEEELNRGFFLDWPTRDMPEAGGAGVHALLAQALLAGAGLCDLIGETLLAEKVRAKVKYLSHSGLRHENMKQVVAMMSFAGHITDSAAAEVLTKGCGRGMSTFQSYYILKAAAKTAGIEKALAMLEQYYGGMLRAGATTFWEDFDVDWIREGARIDRILKPGEYDIHGDNGRYCYQGLRHSLCHGWSAGPAAFLAEEVLGVKIQAAGCKELRIQPELGTLEWAKGSYPTPYGAVIIEVEREGDKVKTKIEAPKEITII